MSILVGVDGSEGAERAAKHAAKMAFGAGESVVLATVIEWSPFGAVSAQELERRTEIRKQEMSAAESEVLEPLKKALLAVHGSLDIKTEVHHGHPAELLCKRAEDEDISQLVSGRRGRGTFTALLFGSVAGSLVQHASVPVTVVP